MTLNERTFVIQGPVLCVCRIGVGEEIETETETEAEMKERERSIYYEELAQVIIESEKSHDLPLASQRPRKVNGIIQFKFKYLM